MYLATDKIYSKAIYKTDIDRVSSNQALTSSKALNCDFVLYSMDYIQNDQNGTDFQIDSSTVCFFIHHYLDYIRVFIANNCFFSHTG